jgi:nicotinate-nucleotide adenylyltransferase
MNNRDRIYLHSARTIGIFGGTFDPIHIGHLILAERAREELRLDAVVFVPALLPPHKVLGRSVAPAANRRDMLELAVASNTRFIVSGHEIERGGISYTVDTLRYFSELLPRAEFTLLLGGDNARDFGKWHDPETIVRLARVAVWDRPESRLPAELLPGVGFERIDSPLFDISSTEIRERVASGKSIRYMTPDVVIEYINKYGLYL